MNEMIINILTVGPSSIEITLHTGEMKSLKNWGWAWISMFFTSNKCFSPMTIVKKNILDATCLLKVSKSRKQFLEELTVPKTVFEIY